MFIILNYFSLFKFCIQIKQKCQVNVETETDGDSSRGRNVQRRNQPLTVASTSSLQVHKLQVFTDIGTTLPAARANVCGY